MVLAANLKRGFDGSKVRLIEKEVTAAAVDLILRTLEVFTLCVEARLLEKPSLHKDHSHTLEDTGLWMPFWEVEGLQLAIWERPIGHPNPFLQLLSIGTINRASLFISHINFYKPVCLLLWLLGFQLWYILQHMSSGEGSRWRFCVDGGIIKNKHVVIIRVVLLKDIHCIFNLPQNILIGEVPFSVCPRPEEYSS